MIVRAFAPSLSSRRVLFWIGAMFWGLLLAGCASGTPTADVEGIVTLDGQPLPDIRVLFQPQGSDATELGVGSSATTDAGGRFVLELMDGKGRGAVIGQHAVTLADKQTETQESDAGSVGVTKKSRIPAKVQSTPMTFEVKGGQKNEAKFDLSSK